jgi:hypothetical protein
VPKKSDMSSRYAAAHARREQRHREAPARQYLPLATETATMTETTGGLGSRIRHASSGNSVLTSRLPSIDYSYLRGDLMRTLVLAVILFAVMIVLSFVL